MGRNCNGGWKYGGSFNTRIVNFSNYFMNGKDENGDDDGVDVAQPHERRVQLIEVLLVDVVHETLSSGPRRAAARRGVPWMK